LGLSPPARANEICMSAIEDTVKYHLQFIGKTCFDLSDHQRAKISLLVLRNQPSLMTDYYYSTALPGMPSADIG
jgi:hypothetical protein